MTAACVARARPRRKKQGRPRKGCSARSRKSFVGGSPWARSPCCWLYEHMPHPHPPPPVSPSGEIVREDGLDGGVGRDGRVGEMWRRRCWRDRQERLDGLIKQPRERVEPFVISCWLFPPPSPFEMRRRWLELFNIPVSNSYPPRLFPPRVRRKKKKDASLSLSFPSLSSSLVVL